MVRIHIRYCPGIGPGRPGVRCGTGGCSRRTSACGPSSPPSPPPRSWRWTLLPPPPLDPSFDRMHYQRGVFPPKDPKDKRKPFSNPPFFFTLPALSPGGVGLPSGAPQLFLTPLSGLISFTGTMKSCHRVNLKDANTGRLHPSPKTTANRFQLLPIFFHPPPLCHQIPNSTLPPLPKHPLAVGAACGCMSHACPFFFIFPCCVSTESS